METEMIFIGVFIGLVIGVLIGLALGRSKGQTRAIPSYHQQRSDLEVIKVLIGIQGNSIDYLGEMVKALVARNRPNSSVPTLEASLRVQENLLRELERNLGLKPVVPLRLNAQGEWVVVYDPQKHESLDAAVAGDSVYVKEPGWEMHLPGQQIIILKKSLVRKNPQLSKREAS